VWRCCGAVVLVASLLEAREAAGERCTPGIRAAFLAMEARLAEMEARVREQAAEIQELKRQLRQNSRNSSLPPSSDPPYVKRRPKKKSGRKRGAQPGHEPHQRSRDRQEAAEKPLRLSHRSHRCPS
jgi:transposase